jgi:hypothetical protein
MLAYFVYFFWGLVGLYIGIGVIYDLSKQFIKPIKNYKNNKKEAILSILAICWLIFSIYYLIYTNK